LGERGVRRALLVIDVQNQPSLGVARAAGAITQRSMREFPTSAVYSLELNRHPSR
jgi:hypothetical protein